MVEPHVGTKGKFEFKPPFDTLLDANLEYRVMALRTMVDLENSGEKPLETIYRPVGMSDIDFKDDLKKDVLIVTLATTGNESFSVPVDRILSQPITSGVKYQEMTIAVKLGELPVEDNFNSLLSDIADVVYDRTGLKTFPTILATSAISIKSFEEDRALKKHRDRFVTIYKSSRTNLRVKEKHIKKLNKYIKDLEHLI